MTNTMFPGRADYVGPTEGWFGLLHHEQLFEVSHDAMERVAYVKKHKPQNEVAIRLHNMIYLGGCPAVAKIATLYADYRAKIATLSADYRAKIATLSADYEAKIATLSAGYKAKIAPLDAEILAYVKAHIPDCAWNGTTLVFPEE